MAQYVKNPTNIHEVACLIPPWPCSVSWVSGVAVSCGVGRRCSLDLVLLWLWCRLAAVAPIPPLAWEPPYATGAAQEIAKRQKDKKKKKIVF